MNTYEYLLKKIEERGACYLILIDPDKIPLEKLPGFIKQCESSEADGFLIGGSLMVSGSLSGTIRAIKDNSCLPAIIFPGSLNQIDAKADAILFISLISGRNPEQLIGTQVIAAPMIKRCNLEAISTGYMLVESGRTTTAEYMSSSKPIPKGKPEIAAATSLAAEYLGMKLLYLEAGSGADEPVPDEMISLVSRVSKLPLIVGGGIKDAATAARKVAAGAKIIVTGNYFEDESKWPEIEEFSSAIHKN